MFDLTYWLILAFLQTGPESLMRLDPPAFQEKRTQAVIFLTEEDFTCPLCMHELFILGDSLSAWDVAAWCIFVPGWRKRDPGMQEMPQIVSGAQVRGWMAVHARSWKIFIDERRLFSPILDGSCLILFSPEDGLLRWRLPMTGEDYRSMRSRLQPRAAAGRISPGIL